MEELGVRLEARGLTLGETFSCLETSRRPPPPPLGGQGLVPVLLGVWLVCRWSSYRAVAGSWWW